MEVFGFLWEIVQVWVDLAVWMWPLTLFIIAAFLFKVGSYLYRAHRIAKSGIAEIDKLNGKEFEIFLEGFFKKQGYQVRRTPYQGDFGADLIIQQANEKTVVQAKRHRGSVGVKAVQEAVASMAYYQCDKAMVVTNSRFTQQARTLAKANRVELWDRDELIARLIAGKREQRAEQPTVVEFAATAAPLPTPPKQSQPAPVCATCGKPVSMKVRDYCMSHAGTFHGLVYCYDHQHDQKKERQKAAVG